MSEADSAKAAAAKKKPATRGKAWGEEEVHVLISSWKAATLQEIPAGFTAKMMVQAIYNQYMDRIVNRKAEERGTEPLSHEEFKKACPKEGPEGGLDVCDASFRPRSLRATEDKVASLKPSFSLNSDHNNGTLVGSADRPSWFDMSKEEHSAILKK
ncbi:unnamed protein product [Phytophthora fragariaefolia]|uniref:Unnamed protein product n=1 Tax=Phytophthora fragariaefolia TaxID=1490495 RepID=A0A9W6Y0Z9_9STRA|nr:unnamed protein product [Phytophthora fragariaefolia]